MGASQTPGQAVGIETQTPPDTPGTTQIATPGDRSPIAHRRLLSRQAACSRRQASCGILMHPSCTPSTTRDARGRVRSLSERCPFPGLSLKLVLHLSAVDGRSARHSSGFAPLGSHEGHRRPCVPYRAACSVSAEDSGHGVPSRITALRWRTHFTKCGRYWARTSDFLLVRQRGGRRESRPVV